MSLFDMMSLVPVDKLNMKVFETQDTRDILLTTGDVAENCAEDFKYTREQQDRFGMESHIKAHEA